MFFINVPLALGLAAVAHRSFFFLTIFMPEVWHFSPYKPERPTFRWR